jgi:hypothetical protein
MKRELPGQKDYAAARCFRGSNIWWTYRSGLRDARLEERVQMNEKDIADWTDAIEKEE